MLVDKIPKLATGKVSRSAIAKSLDIQEIRDGMWELDVTFEASLEVNAGRGSSGVAGHRPIATRDEATQRVAAALSKASGVEDTAACIDTTGSNALVGAVTPADADTEKGAGARDMGAQPLREPESCGQGGLRLRLRLRLRHEQLGRLELERRRRVGLGQRRGHREDG